MITKGNFVSLCSVVTEVYGIHYCFKLARYMMKKKNIKTEKFSQYSILPVGVRSTVNWPREPLMYCSENHVF